MIRLSYIHILLFSVATALSAPTQPIFAQVSPATAPSGSGQPCVDYFPIFPFVAPEPGRFSEAQIREIYRLMAANGLNTVPATPDMLDTCADLGLRVLVMDPRVNRNDLTTLTDTMADRDVQDLVRQINNHRAVVGYWMKDEPVATDFPGLAKLHRALAKHAPGKVGLLGLYPNVVAPEIVLKTPDYETYVRRYVEECQPGVFGYDHYDLFEDRTYPRDTFWQNLEVFRRYSLEKQIPFFAWVQCGAWFMLREPSEADQRYVVFSTLVYGAKGIGYFPYVSPQVLNYRADPINGYGEPTPRYTSLRALNLSLQRLGPHLLRLRSDGVYHHTTFGIPTGSRSRATTDLVRSFRIRDKEYRLVVGEFTHLDTNERFLMIFNADLNRSVEVMPNFAQKPSSIEYFEPYLNKFIDYNGRAWIAPGDARLIRVRF